MNIKISNGKNLIKKNLHKVVLILYTFFSPLIIFAAGTDPSPTLSGCDPAGGKICPTIGAGSVPDLIKKILDGALLLGIPVVALAIIYCGFLFVFARGNSEKLGKAKEALLYTLIGAAILLGSWAIAQMISATITGLGA